MKLLFLLLLLVPISDAFGGVHIENRQLEDDSTKKEVYMKNFYDQHSTLFACYEKSTLDEWLTMVEFDSEGELTDSKACFMEQFLSPSDFEKLLLELYANDNVKKLIVYESDDESDYKTIENPDFINQSIDFPTVVHIWKRRKNSKTGGCSISLTSICAISGELVVIQN